MIFLIWVLWVICICIGEIFLDFIYYSSSCVAVIRKVWLISFKLDNGIDWYVLVKLSAYSCSMELCLNMDGDKKLQYLKYFMHRINVLRYHKITPVVVFDGGNLPCKAGTENERYMYVNLGKSCNCILTFIVWFFNIGSIFFRKRKMNRDLAMENKKNGNISAASELFRVSRVFVFSYYFVSKSC